MKKRLVVALGTAALLALLVLLLVDPGPRTPGTEADGDARDADTGGPQLEAGGAAPPEKVPLPARSVPPVPAADPERPIEAGDIRVRLSGRVLDPTGSPLPDVPVRVYAYFESIKPDAARHAETVTDSGGRFAFDFRPQVQVTTRDPWIRMRVAAFHPTWVMAAAGAYVNTRQVGDDGYAREDIELRMRPACPVVCRVRDEDGRPIANATCALEQFYGRKHWVDGRPVQAVTDEAGEAHFQFPVLGDDVILIQIHGRHAFRVSAPGYATVYTRVQVPERFKPGFVAEATAVLTAPHEFRGRVRDDTGAPLENVELSVTGSRAKPTWAALVYSRWADHALRTGENGSFVIPAVQSGSWKLEFRVEGHRKTGIVAEAGATDLDVRLVRMAPTVLVFRAVPTGRYLSVQSYAIEYEGGSMGGGGGQDVRLELDDLAPGEHTFRVHFTGRVQPFEGRFVAKPGVTEPVIFDVPAAVGATVEGVVTDAGGKPLADAWMTLAPARTDEDEDWRDIDWQTPDEGTFRFEGVTPGRYVLEAERDGYAPRRVAIDVRDAKPRAPLRVVLSRGASLRVLFPPVPTGEEWRYDVRVLHAAGAAIETRRFGADEKNAVVFEHQPPGEALVTLESSQFLARRYDGDPFTRTVMLTDEGETVVSFEDVRPVRVSGRVVKGGKPLASGNLQLRRIGPAFPLGEVNTTWYGRKKAATDETGAFSLGGLLPGRYAVSNLRTGGVPLTFEVRDTPIEDLVLSCDG